MHQNKYVFLQLVSFLDRSKLITLLKQRYNRESSVTTANAEVRISRFDPVSNLSLVEP